MTASGGSAASGRRWHLVCMPWQSLGTPSLALALVRGILTSAYPDIETTEHFCNIRFAEFLMERSGGQITPGHYQDLADHGIALGLGDWVYSGTLYDDPGFREAEMLQYAEDQGASIGMALEMRALAGEFIETVAADITAAGAVVCGLTTTFMQNVPSLALARRVKELSPSSVIVFGGANCDGPMGAALHRSHPFIDYVVRGEAELVVPQLAARILEGSADAGGIDGVCWWRDGKSVANPQLEPAVPPEVIPTPDYDSWHEKFSDSPVREYAAPYMVVEGSRGCWWGEKHHCTFCGLNGQTIGYRSRPAERVLHEIQRLVTRYGVLDVVTADNIMDVSYYKDLLPHLAATGWDLRIHFELKANVDEAQIAQLAAAGLIMVQFGIESFSTRVLKLMRKGLAGATAVRVLRDAQDHGISVAWSYLYGFPGERDEDYLNVIDQMPALAHIQPSLQASGTRIQLTRFSPLFNDPGLGFPHRIPAGFYRYVYDVPDDALRDMAYFWDCPDEGITGDVENRLNKALAAWKRDFPTSYLHVAAEDEGALVLVDRREGWPRRDIELTGWQLAGYKALRRPRAQAGLGAALTETGVTVHGPELGQWLESLVEQGLAFRDDSEQPRYVALATRRVHAKLAG